jgi:hypothetical protein
MRLPRHPPQPELRIPVGRYLSRPIEGRLRGCGGQSEAADPPGSVRRAFPLVLVAILGGHTDPAMPDLLHSFNGRWLPPHTEILLQFRAFENR